MTISEVAAYLRLHPITVHRFVATGALRSLKIGGALRFNREDVERFVRSRESHKRT